MTVSQLPNSPADILKLPDAELPETFRQLVRAHRMSSLLHQIHRDLGSGDRVLRQTSHAALERLGFVV